MTAEELLKNAVVVPIVLTTPSPLFAKNRSYGVVERLTEVLIRPLNVRLSSCRVDGRTASLIQPTATPRPAVYPH